MHARILVSLLLSVLFVAPAMASGERVKIEGEAYRPFYPAEEGERITVRDFLLDATPVTNAQFLAFVREHPRWQRGAVIGLFADDSYLSHWPDVLSVAGIEQQPVVRVSWFAARKYCEAHGGRLPTEAEWEFVVRADPEKKDATRDPAYNQRMLNFYSTPGGQAPAEVGQDTPNYWGVHNMVGLIWEWVEDYNASIVTGDNRQTGDEQNAMFCGGAAATADNTREYATFMRYAFRSSLKPAFTLKNLGFRCAYPLPARR